MSNSIKKSWTVSTGNVNGVQIFTYNSTKGIPSKMSTVSGQLNDGQNIVNIVCLVDPEGPQI